MTGDDLPRDLAILERALFGGRQPSPSLRRRVMDQVQQELCRSQRLAFWQYVSALAALVLLVWNLSVSAASLPRRAIGVDRNRLASLHEQAGQMQLDLSTDEIRRQCLLLAAGYELVPFKTPYGSGTGTAVVLNR